MADVGRRRHRPRRYLGGRPRATATALALLSVVLLGCRGAASARSSGDGERSRKSPGDELEPMLPPLEKHDVVVGDGRAAKEGDTVVVHYVGKLTDGTVFDSSRERAAPLEFTLGSGTVIAGWELGVVGMKSGGRRELTIPPHLGYGRRGSPPRIPPDATLLFDVELLEIQ